MGPLEVRQLADPVVTRPCKKGTAMMTTELHPLRFLVGRVARVLRRFLAGLLMPAALAAGAQPVFLDQGTQWTAATRQDFYGRSQGSMIMPLIWMSALKQADGQPFLADSLGRYGYLPDPNSATPGLPVGFTVSSYGPGGPSIGMTCSACHTRQIEVAGVAYRADGGPAIADFQSFLADLDEAVQTVRQKPAAFQAFADAVLGPKAPPAERKRLRTELSAWHRPYHTLIQRALPTPAWGPSRLDAVSMIFNRLTGLDIGPPPSYLIPGNIQRADAPVRYPFLWNAAIQDKTQWPGFADNGSSVLALGRNVGEVIGVFASFKPRKDWWKLLGIDYLNDNSTDFNGLLALEELIRKIGPPKWPWSVDASLASQGEAIYGRSTSQGGCADCHGVKPGVTRFFEQKT
jgi:cytochrome c553